MPKRVIHISVFYLHILTHITLVPSSNILLNGTPHTGYFIEYIIQWKTNTMATSSNVLFDGKPTHWLLHRMFHSMETNTIIIHNLFTIYVRNKYIIELTLLAYRRHSRNSSQHTYSKLTYNM